MSDSKTFDGAAHRKHLLGTSALPTVPYTDAHFARLARRPKIVITDRAMAMLVDRVHQ